MTFLAVSITFEISLFKKGLPVRGAIDYGNFLIRDYCFAGQPIVNAYKLSSQIEFAATVISEAASDKLHKIQDHNCLLNTFVIDYLVPMKDSEKHMLVLMGQPYDFNESIDNHSIVMASFYGHNKDIPISVRQKVQNTEQWFDFLKYKETCQRQKKKATNTE